MKPGTLYIFLLCLLHLLQAIPAQTMELQGTLTTEGRYFLESPAYAGQKRNNGSLAFEGELYQPLPGGSSLRVEPFFRIDSSDPHRTHGDLRTCNLLYLSDQWEAVIGLDRVFWGVTEFVHLVDIINQTDVIESIDNEEKLGQPMVHLTTERNWGVIEGFVLPSFRKRVYPGEKGRLRGPIPVDGTDALFESSAGEFHPDFSLRYSLSLGQVDFGLYQFFGTSREPVFQQSDTGVLIPLYQQISQTGLDLQLVDNQWLWKLEALYRTGQDGGETAMVAGFEYTLVSPLEISMDVGLVSEYVYDERIVAEFSPYDNDIMLGMRCSLHDAAGTELLLGLVQDLHLATTFYTIEASRRIGDWLRVELSALLFGQVDSTDPASFYREDSFIRLEANFYF